MRRLWFLVVGCLVAGLLGCVGQAAFGQPNDFTRRAWITRGIGGGGALYSPTISPFSPNTIYMSTDMTGVFRTDNFGATWHTLPFTKLAGGVDTQVRFTSNPNVLYAINIGRFGERIPVRSNNGGNTFLPLAVDPTDGETFMLYADPNGTERLLLTDWSRLFYSGNGGQSFSLVYDSADSNLGIHLAGAFWDGTKIYAATSKGLWVSTDNGAHFVVDSKPGIPANEAMVSFAAAKTSSQTRFLAVTFPRDNVWGGIVGSEVGDPANTPRVYRLDSGATAWTLVRNDSPANPDKPFFVAMALNNRNIAFLAGTNADTGAPSVLKSTNGGSAWSPVFHTENNQNIATGWMGDGGDLDWYWAEVALGFAVSPSDANRAIITDYGFAHVTSDGGVSWQQAYVKPVGQNPPGTPTPQGLSYSTAGVEQTSSWWIAWPTPTTMVAGFSDIRGILSDDGGLHWTAGTALGLPHNSTYCIIQHPLNGVLYAGTSTAHDLYESTYLQDSRIDGASGSIIKSVDGGATWQTVVAVGHPVVWLEVDPDDPDTMYASVVHSTLGGIFVTHDLNNPNGPHFVKLSNPPRTEGHPLSIHVLDDGSLVASYSGRRNSSGAFTQSSGVFYSTNGGLTWQDRSDPNFVRWTKDLVIDPHDPSQNTWYAAVFSHWGSYPNEVGGVYRSTNRGLSWIELGDFYRVESIAIHPINPKVAYVTTEADGLWRTTTLNTSHPTFILDRDYPFQHPVRLFFNPWSPKETWATSFGGGLRMLQSPK